MRVLIAHAAVSRTLRAVLWDEPLKNEQGQGLIEYVLIIFLFAIGLVVALQGFGDALGLKYDNLAQAFPMTP